MMRRMRWMILCGMAVLTGSCGHMYTNSKSYGEFRDYGHYRQTDYQDVKDVPAAYWVYVYPHWYVWREKAE